MWEQYKKTFLAMQLVIWVVTLGVLFWSHQWAGAAMFFVIMQIGSVFGVMWGHRLRKKFQRYDARPPRRA